MNRRELLKSIALLTGASVVGGEFLLSGCKNPAAGSLPFSPAMIDLLNEIAETIIPATDTPGAKAADVGSFMKVMISDCYTTEQQQVFMKGIKELDAKAQTSVKKNFMDCTQAQRHDLLTSLEKEAKTYNDGREDKKAPVHYYTMIKQLTLWGFFSSKTGMTETLRHVPVPGRYDGNAPYTKGEKAWAE
ncbi:MAG: gluconate 2-dehydrogenase subunit 3 family protein [Chitinophagia bacterium]|nr:gluconate 2-dehydrogenase subunit 3 family protein [Chitinophagia bacterium]